MASIKELLVKMLEQEASDLHIAVGLPPMVRVDGMLEPLDGHDPLTPEKTRELIYTVLNEEQVKDFESEHELDMSFGLEGLSRFRVNVYRDRGSVVAAFRAIPFGIRTFEELGLPQIVADFAIRPHGLVLVCGATGSGKSTTLAAIIDRINKERNCHIITVEDPIEFLHKHQQSVVNQREVRADTKSFAAALKYVLRQDPDVVLIGEMRDLETMSAAITVAETGHLVFATLHTNDATQTINRIIDVFPSGQQEQVRTQLSFVLEGVVVQQLIPRPTGEGRVLGLEIMMPTPAIRSLIREEKIHQIYSMISIGGGQGMQTMNQSLYKLYYDRKISYEQAMQRSSMPDDLTRLMESGAA
jgi:twitching motility protein PilT